ncbi:MAG: hypothetical protein LBU64_06430 [Planctomycetota bacterium]|jgi:hypothetical protein|nr:hypothetical protein [Planctomycetota bacterium]
MAIIDELAIRIAAGRNPGVKKALDAAVAGNLDNSAGSMAKLFQGGLAGGLTGAPGALRGDPAGNREALAGGGDFPGGKAANVVPGGPGNMKNPAGKPEKTECAEKTNSGDPGVREGNPKELKRNAGIRKAGNIAGPGRDFMETAFRVRQKTSEARLEIVGKPLDKEPGRGGKFSSVAGQNFKGGTLATRHKPAGLVSGRALDAENSKAWREGVGNLAERFPKENPMPDPGEREAIIRGTCQFPGAWAGDSLPAGPRPEKTAREFDSDPPARIVVTADRLPELEGPRPPEREFHPAPSVRDPPPGYLPHDAAANAAVGGILIDTLNQTVNVTVPSAEAQDVARSYADALSGALNELSPAADGFAPGYNN